MSSLGLQDYTPFDGKLPRQRSRTARAFHGAPSQAHCQRGDRDALTRANRTPRIRSSEIVNPFTFRSVRVNSMIVSNEVLKASA